MPLEVRVAASMLLQPKSVGSLRSSPRSSRGSFSKPLARPTQVVMAGVRQLGRTLARLVAPGAQSARRGLAVRAAAAASEVEEEEYEDAPAEPYILPTHEFSEEFENKMFATGNVGRDMEVKRTKFGTIGSFSLAVNTIKGGNKTTDWFTVELFDKKMIDAYKDVVKKGSLCHVQGRLRTDTWGEENSKFRLVIEANTVTLAKPKEEQEDPAAAAPPPPPVAAPQQRRTQSQQASKQQPQQPQQPATPAARGRAPAQQQQQQQQQQNGQQKQAGGSGYSNGSAAGAAAAPPAAAQAPPRDADLTQLNRVDQWAHLIAYPDQWWDNREKKASEKSPDFKAKGQQYNNKVALWLTGKDTPQWAKDKYQSQ